MHATTRDSVAIEARRIKGARLLMCNVPQAEVARRLGVSRQAVSLWARRLAEVDGAVGELKARIPGRRRRLDAAQCAALVQALLNGARRAGFSTDPWTVSRVRALVNREYCVAYSNSGCWELLRSLGFSLSKPEKRVVQPKESPIVTRRRKTGYPGEDRRLG